MRSSFAAALVFAALAPLGCGSGDSTPCSGDACGSADDGGALLPDGASSGAEGGGADRSVGDTGSPGPDSGPGNPDGNPMMGGGVSCDSTGDPDFCLCHPASMYYPANATPCATASLQDPGECCADTGWPASGACTCDSFLCEVNQGGGRDCWFQSKTGGLGMLTTSASGAACCLRGGGICSCYDSVNAGSCSGYTTVSACTYGVIAPCSDVLTQGEMSLASCR